MTVVQNENQTHENANKYVESVPCCVSRAVLSISSAETVCLYIKTQQSNRGGTRNGRKVSLPAVCFAFFLILI